MLVPLLILLLLSKILSDSTFKIVIDMRSRKVERPRLNIVQAIICLVGIELQILVKLDDVRGEFPLISEAHWMPAAVRN
jgi:hypothetical protein